MAKKKSWREKLQTQIRDHQTGLYYVVLPSTEDVENVIKNVGFGNLITARQLRDYLGKSYSADSSCSRVINNVLKALSDVDVKEIACDVDVPFWRVVKNDGQLNPTLRIGLESQASLLEKEGHELIREEGKKPKVNHFEDFLVDTDAFPEFNKGKEVSIRKILLANHSEIEAEIKKIPKGKVATDVQIRDRIARNFGADMTCMKVAGISLSIISHAAEEERVEEGRSYEEMTPYWRVLAGDGSLKPTFPGAPHNQKALLEEEGHTVIQKGKKYVVKEFEQYVV
jgi:alkylated DNA nucleotide flippase Atl1